MDIQEISKEKEKLENDILFFINQKHQDFKTKTGIAPSNISISIICINQIGSTLRDYVVTDVKVSFDCF